MKLYHGTQERNIRSIEVEGLRGSDLSEFTDGFTTSDEDGVVFVTEHLEEALEYGGAVFEIFGFDIEQVIFFDDGNSEHYYIELQHIKNECWIELI